jgi:hypothetical protein
MASVADVLRNELADRVRAMSPEERLDLALRLGEDDLAAYAASRKIEHSEARRVLRRARRAGRQPSGVMESLDR